MTKKLLNNQNLPVAKIIQKNDCCFVSGEIVFDTVVALEVEGSLIIQSQDSTCFDFSEVGHSDSSALVLLLAWIRTANRQHKTISYTNLPEALLIMAQSFDIKSFLPLVAAS
jgi:ABC-type transporter Mla MlaB component